MLLIANRLVYTNIKQYRERQYFCDARSIFAYFGLKFSPRVWTARAKVFRAIPFHFFSFPFHAINIKTFGVRSLFHFYALLDRPYGIPPGQKKRGGWHQKGWLVPGTQGAPRQNITSKYALPGIEQDIANQPLSQRLGQGSAQLVHRATATSAHSRWGQQIQTKYPHAPTWVRNTLLRVPCCTTPAIASVLTDKVTPEIRTTRPTENLRTNATVCSSISEKKCFLYILKIVLLTLAASSGVTDLYPS